LIPPGLLGHDSTYVPRIQPASATAPEQATELELTAVLNPVFFGEYVAFSREISRFFREHHITIRPINKTMDEWREATLQGSVDVVLGRWAADYPDADTFATILDSKAGLLGQLCGSPEVDRLIARGRSESSPAARHAIYRQIEEIIARDRLLMPLFHEQAYRFARPEVEGLSLAYGGIAVDYASLRVQHNRSLSGSSHSL
jgi:peptide/nickel transport system substrate-binding protein